MSGPILIGIDPGFAALGLVVWQNGQFRSADIWRSDKIPGVGASQSNLERGRALAAWLFDRGALNARALICEAMSFPRHASIAHKMGIVWGVLASVSLATPCFQLSPQEIRRLLGLPKRASKADIREKVLAVAPELADLAPQNRTLWPHHYDGAAVVLAWLRTDQGRFLLGEK